MIDPLELGELGNGPKMTQGEREKEQQENKIMNMLVDISSM